MLDEYTDAFSEFLRTGAVGSLAGFCAGDADLRRLGVYRNGFLKACGEALRANYPTVDRLVGADRFPALVRPYVEANPPRSADLSEYGRHFAPTSKRRARSINSGISRPLRLWTVPGRRSTLAGRNGTHRTAPTVARETPRRS